MEGTGQSLAGFLRAGEIAGALEWWRDAGVDCDFADVPQGWLAAPEAPPAARELKREIKPDGPPVSEPPAPARIGGDQALWPQDLARFRQWWLDEPLLDDSAVRGRVPPRGNGETRLMIVVGQPDPEDTDALLSGPGGRMVGAMLAAMGMAPDDVYLASALPRHMPVPDWAELARRGLGDVLRHHVGLVAPKRLLVFGEGALSLLGNDLTQNAQNSSQLYHQGQTIGLLGARDLALLARPAWKARFWRDWLDWTGTETE